MRSQNALATSPKGLAADPLHEALDVAVAQHKKMQEGRAMLDHIREGLDRLTKLGDMVRPEDVIGEAGKMVGAGVPAATMAEILAEMPSQAGQGLAAWVRSHDANITLTEQQFDRQAGVYQHRMGVAAMRAMAGDHIKGLSAKLAGGAGALAPRGAGGGSGMPQTSILQVAQPPGGGAGGETGEQ